MTKLLEQAVARARTLLDDDQDAVALAILSMADTAIDPLDEETRAAISEGLEQARRGEFVPDEEMAALWKRHGL
jgi:predicted transcriptional regulator